VRSAHSVVALVAATDNFPLLHGDLLGKPFMSRWVVNPATRFFALKSVMRRYSMV